MQTYISGKYKKSIYKSDSGYIIGLMKLSETNSQDFCSYVGKLITFTGSFHELILDDDYIFKGEEIEHSKYGLQFQVSSYERVKPSDIEGIVKFLSSDLFNGIGEATAKKVVDVLGTNTLDLILEDKNNLSSIPKLSQKNIDTIYNTLNKYEESHKTIVYLNELGFSVQDSLKIYNKYKNDCTKKLEYNIYDIEDEIEDVSFNKVDEIRKRLSVEDDDIRRIKAAILHIMKELTYNDGDTYFLFDNILNSLNEFLMFNISETDLLDYLSELIDLNKIVLFDDKYYLKEIFDAETNIINKIRYLINNKNDDTKNIDEKLKKLEKENRILYNDLQKDAIRKAINNNILIITGGPGTGKTTIIKAIVELYKRINKFNGVELDAKLALLAPTGRASKRMSETTGYSATTIHRFLKWNKERNEFAINEYNKDNSNLIIVDECSMIDINLLNNLLKGLTNNIKLILVGDFNQLPSVGPGNILKDLIQSNLIDTIYLNLLYRQNEKSYINTLASNIKDNCVGDDCLKKYNDFCFLECNQSSILSNLKNLCENIKQKNYDYKNIQIMAPMYAGINGIDNLNKILQNIFNPPSDDKKEIITGNIIFRENDKILQLKNMPEENVFNGDVGIIKRIVLASTSKSKKNELYIDFDGNMVKYTSKDFIKIKHGYAVSIHKAQGSEFELVVMVMSDEFHRMLYKKLIYTGVTRAKRKLIILGSPNAFLFGINNSNEYIRRTNLKNRLVNE